MLAEFTPKNIATGRNLGGRDVVANGYALRNLCGGEGGPSCALSPTTPVNFMMRTAEWTRCTAIIAAVAGLLAMPSLAHAQYARAQANYRSEQLDVRVVLLDSERGAAAVSATLTQGACSATLTGIGQLNRRTLELAPYVKQPDGDSCRLVLTSDDRWGHVKASTKGNCAPFGGAACEWTGQSAARVPE